MKSSKRKQRSRRKHQKKVVEQVKPERTHDLGELQQEITLECENGITHEMTISQGTDIIEHRPWSDLPIDLVESIAQHLFRMDFAHLTSVCKSWQSIGPLSLFLKCYPLTLTRPDMPLLKNHTPWLMFSQKDDGMHTFWDPLYKKTYIVNIPQLSGSRLRFCKDGWVFVDRGNGSLSFFNAFIREEIRLPDFHDVRKMHTVGISTTPTSSHSVISVFSDLGGDIEAHICGHGDMDWTDYQYENNLPFILSYANPVFLDEVFYVLGHDGKLGIFDPYQLTWEVLEKPKPLKFCNCRLFASCKWENYLVELRGKLFMVFVGFMGTQIHVYRLEYSEKEWVKVQSLEDCILFIGRWTSIMCTAMVEGMADKIHFPIRSGRDGIFYSLKDQRCYPNPDFYESEEYINCTWVEPRWFRPSAAELTWS